MIARRHIAIGAILVAAVSFAILLIPSRRLSKEPHLPPVTYLPEAARAVIQKTMARHGEHTWALTDAVTVLDYDSAIEHATRLVSGGTFARPLTQDATDMNARLPERFFELQYQLRASTDRLVVAARARDGEQLAAAYGQLVQVCISCHSVYLKGPAGVRGAQP